jgi:hypothetical protein
VRYGGDEHLRAAYAADADDGSAAASDPAGGERFVDLGAGVSKTRADLQIGIPAIHSNPGLGEHLGLGARRAVSEHADLGVRAEFDEVHGVALIGVRPIDWRYRFDGPFALSAFAGAARYNLATPAFSLYAGAGVQWRDLLPHWDLALDVRYAQNLARDHLLASDPQGARPDSFYKIETAVLYLSRKF